MDRPVVQIRHEFSIVSAEKSETVATATIERVNDVLWLTNVWTHYEYRHRGYARSIMEHVIALFGEEDIWLILYPYTDRPLSSVELATLFYGKFGFVSVDAPGVMVRRGDAP